MSYDENQLADIILDAAFEIHREVGPGLLESAYESALEYELRERGLTVRHQMPVDFRYKRLEIKEAFKVDLLVNDKVIVELKSVKNIEPVHLKQLLTYLRLADKRLGLLINFNEVMLRNGIRRVANNLEP